jgi:hypothetical protein
MDKSIDAGAEVIGEFFQLWWLRRAKGNDRLDFFGGAEGDGKEVVLVFGGGATESFGEIECNAGGGAIELVLQVRGQFKVLAVEIKFLSKLKAPKVLKVHGFS